MKLSRRQRVAGASALVAGLVIVACWLSFRGDPIAIVVRPGGGGAAIKAAVAKCSAQGGQIQLGPGTYLCREPIVIQSSRISLRGAGASTILKLQEGANCPVLIIGEISEKPRWEVREVRISDLSIDGNREHQDVECWTGECDGGGTTVIRSCGIVVRGASDVLVENVNIARCRSGGLVSEKGVRRLTVRQLECSDHEYDGLACYATTASLFTHLHLYGNKGAGISTDGGFHDNLIADAMITDNRTHGIFMRDSRGNSFQGILIRDSGKDGVFLAEVDDKKEGTAASGNSFIGLNVARSGGYGLRINDSSCRHNLIDGSQFSENQGEIYEAEPGLAKFEAALGR